MVKEMTTAEFQRAPLTAITEPVQVRRYTTVVGVYYPHGQEPETEDLQAKLDTVYGVMPSPSQTNRVKELEDEVAHLKRQLAARSDKAPVRAERHFDLDVLPKQDREFFERKLGGKKK